MPLMTYFLRKAGFCDIERVDEFNLGGIHDTSSIVAKGYKLSLNVAAKVCDDFKIEAHGAVFDGFEINHQASPYQSQGLYYEE